MKFLVFSIILVLLIKSNSAYEVQTWGNVNGKNPMIQRLTGFQNKTFTYPRVNRS